jgi:glycine cleavage system aminomethyltransferase T
MADEKEVGEITSSCFSPRDKSPIALGYIRRGYHTPGMQFNECFVV